MAEPNPTAAEALSEMQELLRSAASDGNSSRLPAVRYTLCREALLRSEFRPSLPGFLFQCLTFARAHDFIHLYHPEVEKRLAFLELEFRACTGGVRARPRFDIFDDTGF
ncbi:MAG TPA: hypothetical protein VGX37_12190 [Allosphingosinicella sp.]|jgi:hypothetical protein|nr:hypothetical protein [Allosphingosinicella sp.]